MVDSLVRYSFSAAILTLLVLPVSLYWMLRAKAALGARSARSVAGQAG